MLFRSDMSARARPGPSASASAGPFALARPGTSAADRAGTLALSSIFKNFPQFVVIHTVKGFSIVNEAEVDVFLELSCFFYDPVDVGNLISLVPQPFLNPT